MANYCNQCAKSLDVPPSLGGLCEDGFVVQDICESCGPCMIDHKGNCVTDNCFFCHKMKSDGGWVLRGSQP